MGRIYDAPFFRRRDMLDYPDARSCEVEFVTLGGDTLAVVQIKSNAVRPVAPDEITHARKVA
jgi:hypothetical protein